MSYILDALRRADAERERGTVPSLQSQQQSIGEDDAVAARPRPLAWAVIALAVALLATLAWMFFGSPSAPSRVPIEGAVAPVPAPLPPLPPLPPAEPAAVTTVTPTNDVAAAAAVAVPAPPRRPALAAQPAPPTRASVDAKRAAARPAIAAPPGVAKDSGEARIYAPAELPEEIRRELPKVAIGGSSYSGDAASRMVMINGQVFHEGDRLGPGLVLENIRRKSAVFAYKGWRYEVVF